MSLITSLITVTLTDHVMRGVLWNGSLPHAAGSEHRKKNKKKGFPERYARREPPTKECGGALLSHTLSSAVPSPRPGLSFRVRKGTGRLTWAMTTAKPIQDGQPENRRPAEPKPATIPVVAVREPDNGREQNASIFRLVTTRNSIPCHPTRNHHRTRPNPPQRKGLENVPRSPVSTGRLHPSQGFHLRPIKHVFRMRATGTKSAKES